MALTKAPEELLDKSLTSELTITTADNTTQLTLKSTDADASIGPILDLTRDSASPAADDNLGAVRFRGDDSGGNSTNYAFLNCFIEDPTDGAEDGLLKIETRVNSSSKERITMNSTETVFNDDSADLDFRVESNGKQYMLFVDGGNDVVGIGTSVPSSYNANADNVVIYDSTGHTGITIAGDTDDYGNIYFAQGTSGSDAYRGYIQYGHSATSDTSYRDVMLFGTATLERMRISGSSGFVSMGNTAADTLNSSSGYADLAVGDGSGNCGISIYTGTSHGGGVAFADGTSSTAAYRGLIQYSHGDDAFSFWASATDTLRLSTSALFPNADDSMDLGGSSKRFDDVYATNGTIQTSDKNAKNTIVDSDLGLSFIKELKPVSYKFNNKTRTHYGLIAQDVKETLDSISKSTENFAGYIEAEVEVDENDDPLNGEGAKWKKTGEKTYGLRYQEFIAPLIKAIQEQQALIETLQAEVKALKEA